MITVRYELGALPTVRSHDPASGRLKTKVWPLWISNPARWRIYASCVTSLKGFAYDAAGSGAIPLTDPVTGSSASVGLAYRCCKP